MAHVESHDKHDHAACQHEDHDHAVDQHDHDHDHMADEHDQHGASPAASSNEIVFPPSQAALIDFAVEQIERKPFSGVIKCSGEIYAAPSSREVVTAPISGRITFTGSTPVVGGKVTSGTTMMTISLGNLLSMEAVESAEIEYTRAKAEFERVETLYDQQIVTQSEFLRAQAEYRRAAAVYEPLKRSRTSRGNAVSAPMTGVVTNVMVSSGDYVEVGQPLFEVASMRRLQLHADVSQRYFNRMADIFDANIKAASSAEVFNLASIGGKLISTGSAVDSHSPMIPVVFEFDNNGSFVAGSMAEVDLLTRSDREVITLPLTAITEQQGLYYVYVQLDEDCYSRRAVTIGADDSRRAVILSGLNEGERVVTRGAVNVKVAAASSGSIPHGHSH